MGISDPLHLPGQEAHVSSCCDVLVFALRMPLSMGGGEQISA